MKNISILGSTGSVGTQALEVAEKNSDKLRVVGLAARRNIGLLKLQIGKYRPLAAAVVDEEKAAELREQVDVEIFSGSEGLLKIASMAEADVVLNAVSGLGGIRATLKTIRSGKDLALANKESLVAAGSLVMREAKKSGSAILPVDSEHSALWQCLNGKKAENIHKLILTCSGGALYGRKGSLENVSVEEALGHKTWNMGRKITIDSATLMNKGFEVIEAMHLFAIEPKDIKVVVHPQSIVHSMVEYRDGSVIAQLANPDMKLPIQYALSYPERWEAPLSRLDFSKSLDFNAPDTERFPCLAYAYEAAEKGGTLPAAMNAANDFMVGEFLAGRCSFGDISIIIRKVMDGHENIEDPSLENIEGAIVQSAIMAEKLLSGKDR